jgi:hypothetical protein
MLRNEVLINGMLEYWNTGILGSGKMESWVIVKFLLTGIKQRNVIFFKSSFQYSIIPLFLPRETFFYFTGAMSELKI